MKCAECGGPLGYVPHPSKLAPHHCNKTIQPGDTLGDCYRAYWARLAKDKL